MPLRPLAVGAHEAAHDPPPDLEATRAGPGRQVPRRDACQQVPEMIGEEHLPEDAVALTPGPGPREPHRILDPETEAPERHAARAVSRDRREDVAAVEGPAHGRPVVCRVGRRHGDRVGALERDAQHPVVRPHEVVAIRMDRQGAPVAPDPRVDDGQMDGTPREEGIRGRQSERAPANVLGWDPVRHVDQAGPWVDPEDHPFDDPHVGIGRPEVREQGDHAARPRETPPPDGPPASVHAGPGASLPSGSARLSA